MSLFVPEMKKKKTVRDSLKHGSNRLQKIVEEMLNDKLLNDNKFITSYTWRQ